MDWGKWTWYKPFRGELTYLWGRKGNMANYMHNLSHSTPCMNVQTHMMEPHYHYPWTTGSMESATPTLWRSFLIYWHTFHQSDPLDSSETTFLAAFTSAPFPSRTSTTSLCPLYADMYSGVAPSWGAQHIHHIQTQMNGWSEHKCWIISFSCHSFHIWDSTNTLLTEWSITHVCDHLKNHDISIGRTYQCVGVESVANPTSCSAKVML